MCNAHNHHPSCTCGWGGDGHLGRRASSTYRHITLFESYSHIPPINGSYESYVNPNASCPVCGDQVFFYQSPDGGRAYFDELGPPWPKHGCTDTSNAPLKIVDYKREFNRSFNWQDQGWMPFHISAAKEVDRKTIRLFGTLEGVETGFYLEAFKVDLESFKGCPTQIKKVGGNRWKISIGSLRGQFFQGHIYKFKSDLPGNLGRSRSRRGTHYREQVKGGVKPNGITGNNAKKVTAIPAGSKNLAVKTTGKAKAKVKHKGNLSPDEKPSRDVGKDKKPKNSAMANAFKRAGFKK